MAGAEWLDGPYYREREREREREGGNLRLPPPAVCNRIESGSRLEAVIPGA